MQNRDFLTRSGLQSWTAASGFVMVRPCHGVNSVVNLLNSIAGVKGSMGLA